MRLFKVFLFYYALIATTTLLLASYFLLPKPLNIATTILLIPVAFLFWIHATDPANVSASKWSLRFMVVVFMLSSLGIFSYFLSAKYLPKSAPILDTTLGEIKQSLIDSNTQDKEFRDRLENEISTLKIKIDTLGNRDLSVLSVNSSVPTGSLGQITAKDANLTKIPVYETIYETNSQESLDSAQYGVVYPFFEKNGDWYKIAQGWVEARWFTEVVKP